jgi:hypothetical protein
MTTQLKWYLVKLVYEVASADGTPTSQFEEQVRLIRAEELDWAREKATVLGQIGGFALLNPGCNEANRKFLNVADVCQIEDGLHIFSTTSESRSLYYH